MGFVREFEREMAKQAFKCGLCGKVVTLKKGESLEDAVLRHARWHARKVSPKFMPRQQAISWYFGAIWTNMKRV